MPSPTELREISIIAVVAIVIFAVGYGFGLRSQKDGIYLEMAGAPTFLSDANGQQYLSYPVRKFKIPNKIGTN